MGTSISAQEALQELRTNPASYGTPEELRTLADQVSIDSPGKVTVLYSGRVTDNVSSWNVVRAMEEAGEDVRLIDRTELSAFLNSRDFINATARAYGIDLRDIQDRTPAAKAANDWLYHPADGPWADASARFADATRGEVKVVASGAAPDRVFAQTELPRILANLEVTTVEGIPRQTLAARQASHGSQAAFEMVVANSHDNVGTIRTAVNAQGVPLRGETGHLQLDSREYFKSTSIDGKAPAFHEVTRPMGVMMGETNDFARSGRVHLDDMARVSATPAHVPGNGGRVLGMIAGGLSSAAVTAYEWNDTHQQAQVFRNTLNNDTAAQDAYVRQGAQTAGAAVGTLAGGVAASVAGLGTGGTFALVAAEGYLFATAAERAVEKWQQEKIYSQTDREGVSWQFNGRQWLREDLRADLVDDGRDAAQRHSFSAMPDKARELSAMAGAEAVKQSLADVPEPRNPFVLPADDSDRYSLRTRNWNYEPESGKWLREVVTGLDHREMPSKFETIEADPARAARLSAQAVAIIDSNLQAGPAGIAAQYEIGHKARGYEQTVAGAIPPAVTTALDPDLLQASDGTHYRRDAQGGWTHAGEAASATRGLEL